MTRGKFITLEGIDGAGKSTHVQAVAAKLRARIGKEVVVTREPGGTELGEKLRVLLLTEAMHAETEALLMFAARREHVERVIAPALALGRWVVSDRFSDASFAYQGGGRGVPVRKLIALEDWVHAELQPDLTLLFDLPPQAAQRRVAASTPSLDRFEREQVGFFERVRAAYLERARCNPDRIVIIDAARPLSAVSEQVEQVITQRL